MTESRKGIVPVLVLLSLLGSWFLFFRFWPLAAVVVLASGITLGFHYRKGSLAVLLLSPFVLVPLFFLAWGLWGYASGGGCLRTHGERSPEPYNLDPKYRCPHVSTGCTFDGSEFLSENANNLAIEILTSLFGPMRGAYRGPYPDRAEALQAAAASTLHFLPAEFSAFAAGLGLPPGEPTELLQRDLNQLLDKDLPISAAIYQGELVILGREKGLFLVDRKTGKRVAWYLFQYSAWSLLADRDFDQAIAGLDHAIEVDPRNPRYLKERGDAHAGKGNAAAAAADYEKALQLAPKDWYQRAEAEGALRRVKPAGP